MRPYQILLVEDDPDTQLHLVALMNTTCVPCEYNMTMVASIAGAKKTIETKGGFDLMILDGEVEDGTTPRLIRGLRAQGCSCPIFACSGNTRVAQQMMEAGATLRFDKPIDPDKFLAAVTQYLPTEATVHSS